jgi:hypothetical protein
MGAGVWLVMASLFLARPAAAHTPGLSTAEFSVGAGGRVDARLVFATSEPLGALRLDRDRDGVVGPEDVEAARADLAAFVADGVDVSAALHDQAGVRCPGTFRDAVLTEVDGLVLTATYACPEEAPTIEVTLFYLSALPRGHRELARITAGGATTEAVLSGERRALAMDLPDDGRAARAEARRRKGRQLIALTAVFTALMLALFVWRWRARAAGTRGS